MWASEISKETLTDEIIDSLLFDGLDDDGTEADCIITLGSKKAAVYRVPVAAEAFFSGRSEKIMLCGGKIRDFPNGRMTEAESMYQKAVGMGIPKESIIVEKRSQNTIENILCSLFELQRSMWLNRVKSVLLVTAAYHMRRSINTARYLFPAHISVYPSPADDTATKRNSWMSTAVGTERVIAEALNIAECVNNGVFPDFEI